MRLPSKITSYSESVLSKFPIILSCISGRSITIWNLYDESKGCFLSVEEFLDTLDCLYALHKIDIDGEGRITQNAM